MDHIPICTATIKLPASPHAEDGRFLWWGISHINERQQQKGINE